MNKLTSLASLLAVCSLGVSTTHAVLLVSDDFDYAAGTLGTANGGTGWVSTYGNTYSGGVVGGSAVGTVTAGSLDNGANPFNPAGNRLAVGGGTNFRQFSTTTLIARDSNETLYFSFMLTPTALGTNNGNIFQIKSTDNAFSHVEVGFNPSGQWAIGGGYGGGGGGTGVTAAAGSGTGAGAAFALNQSFFVVGKVVTSSTGNDNLYVQIYGGDGIVSTTDTLATSNLLNFSVNRTGVSGAQALSFNTSGAGAAGAIDGFRMATDYASVTAIPEPSSFVVLAGLGALGFVGLRRRRRG